MQTASNATSPTDGVRRVMPVLQAPIDVVSPASATARIAKWASSRESRYVCICNVHSVVTASGDAEFLQVIQGADMATPDGAPLAWMMRRQGVTGQERVSGAELMYDYFDHASASGDSIFLYGSTVDTLEKLRDKLGVRWPRLRIAGMHSPPFRPLSEQEDADVVRMINDSGAGTVWVSLGCPKQERWMAAHRGRVQGVMVGVGAAFEFEAGTVVRAPEWMRRRGLEWLHRLLSEPRRLWKRYLVTNSVFIIAAARQLLAHRFQRS